MEEVFKNIPDRMQGENIPIEQKIEKTRQAMETYIIHIIELTKILSPNTPLEVRTKRELQCFFFFI
jgi:hypothetical protein